MNPSAGEWADSVHFSTGKDNWGTPDSVFFPLDAEFGFTLDAAADPTNARVWEWFGPGGVAEDALAVDWGVHGLPGGEVVWVNPPYSRGLQARFIRKAAEQARLGHTIVMLLPARPDTKVFHEVIWDREKHQPRPGVEVRFIKGRVRFDGAPASAPFPSMVVIFRNRRKKAA